MNGKREHFSLEDFKACAKTVSMKRGMAEDIVEDVQQTVSEWGEYAEQAGVPERHIEKVQRSLLMRGLD